MNRPHDIVFLNMSRASDWRKGVVNRNYYVTRELQRMPEIRKILLIDVFPISFKRLLKVWKEDIAFSTMKKPLRRSVSYRLSELRDEKEYHLSTIQPYYSEDSFLRTLHDILQSLSFENCILWSYLPTYVGVFTSSLFQRKIFDAVDDWTQHPSYTNQQRRLAAHYQNISKNADLIFTVSSSLKSLFRQNTNVHWVPNGVDVERFRKMNTINEKNKKNHIIVYVGVIQERVDMDLLAWIAQKRPQYTFRLIGPVWKQAQTEKVKNISNVHFTGFQPSWKIPELIQDASVGIVPHHANAFVQSMNPMKIYEYLAAGIPVVTTNIPDFKGLPEGIYQSSTYETFLENLDAAISHPPSAETLRSSVITHSWQTRVKTMWSHVDSLLS